jgi:ABC-type multidrug transport system fused ATPase/permease subunit
VLSVHPADQYAVRALRAGASGYLTKDLAAEELVTVSALLVLDLAIAAPCFDSAGGSKHVWGRRCSSNFLRSAISTSAAVSSPILAHRAHSIDALRLLPDLGSRFLRMSSQLVCTALALAWLDPSSTWLALLSAAFALAIPLSAQRLLAERELRQRSHAAALSHHYLDSLLGLTAARTHAAERPLRQRHERLLVEWGRASVQLLRGGVVIEGAQMLVGSILAVWLVLAFVGRGHQAGSTLLFVYWAVNLPVLGRDLAGIIRQFPAYRNILARVLEPLSAPAETPDVPPVTSERLPEAAELSKSMLVVAHA